MSIRPLPTCTCPPCMQMREHGSACSVDDRRERIATAALQGLLARGSDEPMQRYDNWREEFAREAIRFADDLIAELDRTAKPAPADEAVRLLARLLPHIGDGARMEDIERASELVREADGGAR